MSEKRVKLIEFAGYEKRQKKWNGINKMSGREVETAPKGCISKMSSIVFN